MYGVWCVENVYVSVNEDTHLWMCVCEELSILSFYYTVSLVLERAARIPRKTKKQNYKCVYEAKYNDEKRCVLLFIRASLFAKY